HYRIYGKLIEKEILNYYSVPDVIEYLKRVHLLKVGGKTQFAEISKKSRKLIEKLGYVLPEEPITKKVTVTDRIEDFVNKSNGIRWGFQ
ncbi:hypothetical protein C5S39_11280, partial [Candidatus Methanophagaceae archaeon]